jgi:hypothetical protein
VEKADAIEAEPIVNVTLDELLLLVPMRGRSGADLRNAVGDLKANLRFLLRTDTVGPPLVNCFDLAMRAGVSLPQILQVRTVAWGSTPKTVGAILIQDSLVELCLVDAGKLICKMIFDSRQQVETIKDKMNKVFAEIEEEVANQMESMTYLDLVRLHAAVVAHLVETARPLPEMLNFQFGFSQPTLIMAYKLYSDAGRADQLRKENAVVHPAFARPYGRALSL